jgi:hypothetical protein
MIRHYLHRFHELGPSRSLERLWLRFESTASRRGQAWRWHLTDTRITSDADLLSRTVGDWPSCTALLDHLARRPESSFLMDHTAPADAMRCLRRHYPDAVDSIMAQADAACRREFDLHHHPVRFLGPVNWQTDPVSGWRWPQKYISLLDPIAYARDCPADMLLVWALNRHPHFVKLGMAYWLSGDPCYVTAVAEQVTSWIAANPPGYGINWFSSLEIATRLIAWTLTFQFFRGADAFPAVPMLKSIVEQTDFLRHHLTTWEQVPNNHLIGEAAALAVVGAVFPEFQMAADWRQTGLDVLVEQAKAQTHPDGVNKEQATGYQRMVMECMFAIVALSRRKLLPEVPVIEDTLQRMLDYVAGTCTPDGTMPMWGDADSTHPLALGTDFWDFRPLLALGAVMFNRGDWKYISSHFSPEAFWLLGSHGLDAWHALEAHEPSQTSRAFEYGGIYVLRDAWTSTTDLACFRCGPFGLGSEAAHAHCDLLSLQMWLAGHPLLVDSGTYTYHGPWRDQMRLTAAHNTLLVDGCEQAVPRTHFAWQTIPQAEMVACDTTYVTGKLQAAPGVGHQRTIQHPRPGQWAIIDRLEGAGHHEAMWHFHLAPELHLQREQDGHWQVCAGRNAFARVIVPSEVETQVQQGWHSRSYGCKESQEVLVGKWQGVIADDSVQFEWEIRYLGR